jgi:hypothetical protein
VQKGRGCWVLNTVRFKLLKNNNNNNNKIKINNTQQLMHPWVRDMREGGVKIELVQTDPLIKLHPAVVHLQLIKVWFHRSQLYERIIFSLFNNKKKKKIKK